VFDGSNDYINIPYAASLNLTGDLTMAAWINATTTASMRRIITLPSSATGGSEQYSLTLNAGTLQMWIGESGSSCPAAADCSISAAFTSTGSWHHVAGTISGTSMTLYIDGVQAATGASSGVRSSHNNGNLQIGRFSSSFVQPFSGSIDDARLYNRALSAPEISALALLSCPTERKIIYNTTYHVLEFCNGTVWTPLGYGTGGGGGGCSNPAGVEGKATYNTTYHTYQFCNGTNWVKFQGAGRGVIPTSIDGYFVMSKTGA
jgi:hypothetical protein